MNWSYFTKATITKSQDRCHGLSGYDWKPQVTAGHSCKDRRTPKWTI